MKKPSPRADHLRRALAQEAARVMSEHGVRDFLFAKRKAAERFGPAESAAAAAAPLTLGQSAEKNLAMALLRYSSVTQDVGRTLEPHRLCAFIYELAGAYASFFDACPVLTAPDEATRRSRLRLCSLTERVLVDALTLLGIPVIGRM